MKNKIKKISRTISLISFLFLGGIIQVKAESETVSLNNPLGETTSPEVFIGQVINSVLGIVGSLALVMFIYGGLMWMLAAGNTEKIEKGKNILTWATIGLVVIFASFALVHFVIYDAILSST